ncbi:MAG: hypothetical protein M1826_004677 [Phylliscum demangeonii]|nr:MAG: hypothetical protein M1826_004677 [Phylliscum demangeonii]
MAYLATIHKPSSIRHALKLSCLNGDVSEDYLVVAKSNILEIYSWTGSGLVRQCSRSVYGRITILERFRPVSTKADHLLVGTDRSTYFTLSWHPQSQEVRTEGKYVDVTDRGARDTQMGEKGLACPDGRFIVLQHFEGILTVVPLNPKTKGRQKADESGGLGEPLQARIPELFIRSLAFVHGYAKTRLAILWEDGHNRVHLRTKELELTGPRFADGGAVELRDTDTLLPNLKDKGSNHIIPVPEPVRGLIILGESSIMYVDDSNNESKSIALEEATIFVAWTPLSDIRYILADDYGKLYACELLIVDGNVLQDISIQMIGRTSRASCLVQLSGNDIFLGSHQGDSQVISVDLDQQSVQVAQTLQNIAPILDFTIMDLGNRTGEAQMNEYSSGQARIVTGSGAFQDGSLRSVRSGVGLEDRGLLTEIEGVQNLFSLTPSSSAEFVDTLVVSVLDETRVFRFGDEGDVEELEDYKGFSMAESTLLAANIPGDRLIQVTPSVVNLIDAEGGAVLARWAPAQSQRVTDASVNENHLLLAVAGTELVLLDLAAELAELAQRDYGADSQIACVTLPKMSSDVAVVGIWQEAKIALIRLSTLEPFHQVRVGEAGHASVPRGLLLVHVLPAESPVLFVAMADGTVVSFSVDVNDWSLSSRKSIVLGIHEARLQALPRADGLFNVFATCEHPSLIYGSEGRVVYSAVTAAEATCVCSFNAEAFPNSIVVATDQELKIAVIDEERRTHVRDLHIGETVRRLAYSSKLKAFGVGTIRRTLEQGVEKVKSHIKLVDEVLLDALDTYDLNDDELVEAVISTELGDESGKGLAEKFIVGTGYLDEERDESVRGRIIVFEVDEERKLRVLTELAVKGACRCLGVIHGRIVAGLIKTVVIYSFEYEATRARLVKRASYRTSTAPIDLVVTDDVIAVADLMKSVSIVEYRAGKDGLPDSLDEVARHRQTAWGTAVAHVAEDTFLESDAEGNLMVLHRNRHGVTDDDGRTLEVTSEMCLGEMVNRIRRITIPISAEAVVIPRAFLATVDGSLYLFALISPKKQDLLMRLQTQIAARVDRLGQLSFNRYRAFRNAVREADEPFRFVDGDLIERFLDCSSALQVEMVADLAVDADVDEVRNMVEGLKRLR